MLVQQFDVCEGKVATLSFTFPLPLAIYIYFGHLHHVAHLWRKGRERVRAHRNTADMNMVHVAHTDIMWSYSSVAQTSQTDVLLFTEHSTQFNISVPKLGRCAVWFLTTRPKATDMLLILTPQAKVMFP